MNYRYTQKDIKIIDMSNEADFMYNWIRRHGGRVKTDVTTDETNDSGSNKNNKDEMDNNNHIQSNEYSSKDTNTK